MKKFEIYLRKKGLSKSTIKTYLESVNLYFKHCEIITPKRLASFKNWLIDHYKPKTINSRIHAINKYLVFIGKEHLKIPNIKLQQKSFLENVISDADYTFLKNSLLSDGDKFGYFMVRYLAATGARVSEFVKIKIEHVKMGYFDIYSKGGKIRRIYIPKTLQIETLKWISECGRRSGFLFKSQRGYVISTRTVERLLKIYAQRYNISPELMYPHSFRHRFAKNFLDKHQDIALLADLMGHDSIETTRIYLKKTANEQKEIVDNVVTW